MLGFNDTSTLVGHFVLSPKEREKRDRKDSRGDESKGQGRKRNRNESGEIKTFPLYPYLQGQQALPNCKPISVGGPSDVRYTTPSPHPTTNYLINRPIASGKAHFLMLMMMVFLCPFNIHIQVILR